MADSSFEIVFRGDIAPGNSLSEVRERLQQLFKADDAQLERLFSGRPVVLKRGLDRETGERYRDAISKAGALVEVRQAAPDSEVSDTGHVPETRTEVADSRGEDAGEYQDADEGGWGVAPPGADVLAADERTEHEPRNIKTSHLSVAPPGADVLSETERSKLVEKDIDTSHLSYKKNE